MFYPGGMETSHRGVAATKAQTTKTSKQMAFEVRPSQGRRVPKWVKEPLVK